ncbi:MAG: hypothetical protein HeimC2_34200 [Candidatus Heimdallarchaeota archaeon LC_2]|nr:MAG: hypothetical protein HeimC2_34200 [Candidatus Heimdallarchaeota archaeon LC_2]
MGIFNKLFRRERSHERRSQHSFDHDLSKIRYNLNGLMNMYDKITYLAIGKDAEQIRSYWNTICSTINNSELKGISPIFIPIKKQWIDKYYETEIKKLITDTTDFLNHILADETKLEEIFLWSLINPDLRKVAQKKFNDGHYSASAEDCVKLLISEIQSIYTTQTGKEADGTDLMHKVFSPNDPLLKFSGGSAKSTQSLQQGYHNLFSGAVSTIRNQFAHEIISKTKSEAIEIIFVINYLKNSLKKAKLST